MSRAGWQLLWFGIAWMLGWSGPLVRAQADETAKNNTLAAAVQPYVDREELAGAVMLVADKSKILAHETAGYCDVAARKPMPLDAMFWIASQSKPITGTALMLLIDEGKVSADDPVEKYLPEFKGQMVIAEKDADHVLLKKPPHPITVKNVLTHTSGLPFRSPIEQPTLDLLPLRDRVRSYAMLPLDFPPDSKYQYSNAGINTAARIVEVVTGKSFEAFLDERLFQPLGMHDTTFWPSDAQAARIAKAYKPLNPKSGLSEVTIEQLHKPYTDRKVREAMPAGGLFSTARDLARFYQMIANRGELDGKRYLSEAAVAQLTSRQTPAELKDSYGFGFAVGGSTVGHGGAYSTNSQLDTKTGLIYVWLVQHAGFPGDGAKAQDAFRRAAQNAFVK